MDANILVAIITSVSTGASTALVAVTAIILNNKRFDAMDKRFDGIDKRLDRIDTRFDKMDARLDRMEGQSTSRFDRLEEDLKQFFRLHSEHATDIARLKDKADLK